MPALGQTKRGAGARRVRRQRSRSIFVSCGEQPREVVAARFWPKVNIQGYEPEVCWVWRTYRKQSGYGEFDRIGAHRVAFWLATGVEPGDAHVLHSCDNPPCVRPSHLRPGSHLDNMADKVRRGRVRYYTVIPVGQVADMRRRYLRGERVPDLADRFRISFSQAQRIVTGRSRKGTVE